MRDNSGQMLAYCDTGLIGGSDCSGPSPVNPIYEYSYDALGRAYSINHHYLNLVQSYGFDAFGNRKSMAVTRGAETLISFSYTYGPTDRLSEMTDNRIGEDDGTTSFTFTNSGRMQSILHSNLTQTDYTYNPTTGQLSAIDHLRSDGSEILTLDYAYDARNNITSKTIDGVPTSYGYDSKSQLTSVQVASAQTEGYSYDAKGNRLTSLDNPDWNYNPGDQLTDYNGHSFTYDANGNMTEINSSGQIEELEYSVDDRLQRYNKLGTPGTVGVYSYDLYSLRVKKDVNFTDTTYYLYDGTVLLAELDLAKNLTRYYGFLPGSYFPLSLNDVSGSNISTHVYHNDHLMTPLRLTDSIESLSWAANYEAFGKVSITIENVINNLRFPGQWKDPESGFNYNHFRYYMPSLGRYNRKDPIMAIWYDDILALTFLMVNNIIDNKIFIYQKILKENSNQLINNRYIYTYSNSNPLFFFDVSGLDCEEDCSRWEGKIFIFVCTGLAGLGSLICAPGVVASLACGAALGGLCSWYQIDFIIQSCRAQCNTPCPPSFPKGFF